MAAAFLAGLITTQIGLETAASAAQNTTTTVTASANPVAVGQTVTFTAHISPCFGTLPTGSVSWTIGGAFQGSTPVSGCTSSLVRVASNSGVFPVSATYSGDANYFGSSSSGFSETVTGGGGGGSPNAPVITQQPTSVTVPAGGNASFSANATGNPPPSVLWLESTNGGASFLSTGVTTPILTVSNAQPGQNGIQFKAVFSNAAGAATSSVATLFVSGTCASFNCCTSGVNCCTSGFNCCTSGFNCCTAGFNCCTTAGCCTSTVNCCTTTNCCTSGFNCCTTAGCCTSTVNCCTTTGCCTSGFNCCTTTGCCTSSFNCCTTTSCTGAPVVTLQPSSQTVPVGANVTFSASATGSPAPTVQWLESTNGGATFFPTGVTTPNLVVSGALASQNGDQFKAVFTNANGTATTNTAVLTISGVSTGTPTAPVITQNPASQSVTVGGSAVFSAAASGNPTPTVVWQVSTNGGATWTSTGVTLPLYQITNATASQNGEQVRAVFTNSSGSATTTPATLMVTNASPPPPVVVPPSTNTCAPGNPAFVCQVFLDVLGRQADSNGIATFVGMLNAGTASRSDVAMDVLTSVEYRGDLIAMWYQEIFHRPVDPTGLALNQNLFASGATDEQIIAGLMGSGEYYANRGGSTPQGFVTALYQDLFGRAPDAGGMALWTGALASGVSRQQVALDLLSSQEWRNGLVADYYEAYLGRAADTPGLVFWTTQMSNGVSDEAVQAQIIGSQEYFNIA